MIKTGIVCGCLPTQAGISITELYHQLLAEKVLDQCGEKINISSIWYTTLTESKNKVLELIKKETPEIILYHVRPDPYLRLSKLFIRFRDPGSRSHMVFNLKADDGCIKQKEYPPENSRPVKEKALWRKFFREINYIAGLWAGINNRVIEKEKMVLQEITEVCDERNIKLILIGPASRPRSIMENYLLHRLELKLAIKFKNSTFHYITCFGVKGKNNENLFFEDGIHVSQAGHQRLAELIFPVFIKCIKIKNFRKDNIYSDCC